MDSRKGNRTQPNPNRAKNRGQPRATSSSQPNPNRGQPNQFANQQFTNQFANQVDFSQFANQQFGFSQFANQQQFDMPVQTDYSGFRLNPYPPPRDHFQPDIESDDEDDEVPETQEEVEVIPAPTKMKARAWSQVEEEALAKAYINVSEDPYKGNHQTHNSFWKKMLAEFNTHLGKDSGRTQHQVNSKWKDLNTKVTSFAGIYNNKKSNMGSGTNDEDVLKSAHSEYMRKNHTKMAFNHFAAWEIMRKSPKWSGVKTFEEMKDSSSKRARTSESNVRSFEADFSPIDLNDEQCEQDEPEQPARPTPPPRRKGKKPVESTSTEREELMKLVSEYNAYNKDEVEDKKRARAEKLHMKEKEMEARIARDNEVASLAQEQKRQMMEQQKQNDLEFILKPHDQYEGPLLHTVLARKHEIAERWGWEF